MIKYLGIILAAISLFPSSTGAPTGYENLCNNMKRSIAEFVDDPNFSIGSVNKRSRVAFTEEFSLKYFANQRFTIPELAAIEENDPELHHLLSLSPFANDPFLVFRALVEDVVKGKKPYDRLYLPLLSYLVRFNNKLSPEEQERLLGDEFPGFEHYLVRYHESRGDYKSAFEVIMGTNEGILKWFYARKEKADMYRMFIQNPQLVEVIKASFNGIYNLNAFLTISSQQLRAHWTFRCILYNAPEYYFIDFLAHDHELIMLVLRHSEILHTEVPETEYPRINAQMKRYLVDFFAPVSMRNRVFYNALTDIRYGHETTEPIDFSILNIHQTCVLAKVAAISKKTDIFRQIYDILGVPFIESLKQYYPYGSIEHVTILFEALSNASVGDREAFFTDPLNLRLLSRYYAIRNINIVDDKLVVDIVAPESTLALNLPPFHRFTLIASAETYKTLFDTQGINNSLWKHMQIIDEQTFYTFLTDYKQLPILIQYNNVETSLEVIKLILSSPVLIEKIRNMGIILSFNHENDDEEQVKTISELFDSIEDTHGLRQNFDLEEFFNDIITNFRSKSHLMKFEEISGKSVFDIFLNRDQEEMTEKDYFRWRLILSYSIKGVQRHCVTEITSPVIKKLLRTEFHDDMLEIVGR